MKGIAHGDRTAFRTLFDRYSSTALALAWRLLRQRHLAEEAVQEAFLALWRDPERYRPEAGPVRAWLMAAVHHTAVDAVRREESQRKRAAELVSVAPTERGPGDPCEVVVDVIGSAEDRRAVRQALNDLGPGQRQVIELMYFEGLAQTRISELLALPLGTVKSRTRLAMGYLRAALGALER